MKSLLSRRGLLTGAAAIAAYAPLAKANNFLINPYAFEPASPFATWNSAQSGTNLDYTNGNLSIQQSGESTSGGSAIATVGKSAGKYYFELTYTTEVSLPGVLLGFTSGTYNQVVSLATTGADDFWYDSGGRTNTDGSPAETTGSTTWTQGDTVGAAIDTDTGEIWFKDEAGNWLTATNDADVAAGNNPDFTGGAGTYFPIAGIQNGAANGNIVTANFGATPFVHSVPSGFGKFEV